ncbi:MAG: asparagine synthase (glutamine-hydrolyzing) [Gemmatimonadaceae bacterium]|nr:asparagine synthase (glutamine-hydrolyzing) [Gemmatimonadaceae bacterium]
MCGIAGALSFDAPVDMALLEQQRDSMRHRGPDSAGLWQSDHGKVGFAHRRLAIIDLSPGGHQPMTHAETGVTITFNGEIYNYVALRDELRGRGHTFRTHSDTEVILSAFVEWGVECVSRLDGMFAFAIFDPRVDLVHLARDRAGEKPLFYRRTADGLGFASEAKALLADPSCPRRIRLQSLDEYFAYGYVTGEHTLFADILRVAPAGLMTVDLRSGRIDSRQYWTLPSLERSQDVADTSAIEDQLLEVLQGAVKRQLVADVPVGILLSGGVDSSIVGALAAKVSRSPVRTFTVRFPGHGEFDEGPFARMVADHLGTKHTEIEATPPSPELMGQLVAQFDEPISDSSMIPTYLVSKAIRDYATVAIGGDGGDELFGGYHRYSAQLRQERLRRQLPRPLRALMARASTFLPVAAPGRGFLTALGGSADDSIANPGRIFRADERPSLSDALETQPLSDGATAEALRRSAMRSRGSLLQRATAVDFSSYMVDDVLVKVDRASMLTSLEVRAPFLDRSVIEFAFSKVPDVFKATETGRKLILRKIGSRLLPSSLDLTRKQGFSIPMNSWLQNEWASVVDDAMSGPKPMLVKPESVRRYRRLLQQGKPVGDRLFALAFLLMWERTYHPTDVVLA